MFATQLLPEIVLRECPDRRRQERFVHRHSVTVDGRPVIGRDISAAGIGVVMSLAARPGELVYVTVDDAANGGRVTTPARVARVQPMADRVVVGLQFLQQ